MGKCAVTYGYSWEKTAASMEKGFWHCNRSGQKRKSIQQDRRLMQSQDFILNFTDLTLKSQADDQFSGQTCLPMVA